jgi:hypothetical protein
MADGIPVPGILIVVDNAPVGEQVTDLINYLNYELPEGIVREMRTWETEDMNRQYPNSEMLAGQEASVPVLTPRMASVGHGETGGGDFVPPRQYQTRVWPRSRKDLLRARGSKFRPRVRQRVGIRRPILRPQMWDMLVDRMRTLLSKTIDLAWR